MMINENESDNEQAEKSTVKTVSMKGQNTIDTEIKAKRNNVFFFRFNYLQNYESGKRKQIRGEVSM